MKFRIRVLIFFIGLNSMCFGCTYTSTKKITPAFSIPDQQILRNLERIVKFKHVNIDGVEETKNEKANKILVVKIINPAITSISNEAVQTLSKQIAQQLKFELTDSAAFDNYKILFIYQHNKNGLSVSSYKGQTISSSGLKKNL